MTAQMSYYVSATAIVIENRNNGLRNRKLDFTRYARDAFHSHLNADIRTPHPNIYVFVQSLVRHQASTSVLSSLLAFTRAPSRTRSQKAAQLQFFTDYTRGKLDQLGYIFGALDIANCALSRGSMLK